MLAPTGLALGRNGTLYVADTQTNTISAIPRALSRTTAEASTAGLLSAGGALDAPLGMTLVKNGAGDLFGLITTPEGILAVNDGTNALDLFRS